METASTRPDVITAAFSGAGVVVGPHANFTAAPGVSDCLKFAAAPDAIIRGMVTASGGSENACDINHESYVTIEDGATLVLHGGDQAGLVVKGGSSLTAHGTGCVIIEPSPNSKCDVLCDDWSDQSQDPSTVLTPVRRTDGQPVRVVFGRWQRPGIIGPSRVVWGWTIALHFYNPAKAIVRKCLGIKMGEKGPSWM